MDLTLLGVFGAGLLTFISPCVLPMVPIVAANYMNYRPSLWPKDDGLDVFQI